MPRKKAENHKVELAVMANDIKNIKDDVSEIKDKLDNQYVTKTEFEPVKKVVYGIVGLILTAVIAALIGLSPIVGAFAAGMALAGSRLIARVRDYTERLSILFSPIFFAVIGAEFNIRVLGLDGLSIILLGLNSSA